MDDHVDPLAQHVEVGIGDERGDLDQRVTGEIQPGHLTVDPDEKVSHRDRLAAAQVSRLGTGGGPDR
ncbi:hypothetical protein GCM10027259_07450 [Micromonospora palomenae]